MACLLMPARSASVAGPNPVRPGKLQHRHMRQAQFVKTGGVELLDKPAMDRLSRNAQQGADQHVLGFHRQTFEGEGH